MTLSLVEYYVWYLFELLNITEKKENGALQNLILYVRTSLFFCFPHSSSVDNSISYTT